MSKNLVKTDIAVIGAGPGGEAAALEASKAGLKTVLIESGELGGTCLNRGCVPAKTWLAAAHLYRANSLAEKIGAKISKPDIKEIKKHQADVVGIMQKGLNSVFKKSGVEIVNGKAKFLSASKLECGKTTIEFSNAIIATGTVPIDIFGTAPNFLNSDSIFQIDKIPSSVIVIGGGAIGIEMATFFSSMKSEVTVIEALSEILPTEDSDIQATVKRELKRDGVKFHTGISVEEATSGNGSCKVRLANGAVIESEILFSAIGRKPSTDGLSLNSAGIDTDSKGYIKVDETMKTSTDNIYAVGDIAGNSLLAYTAHHEAVNAVKNISGGKNQINYLQVPSIIFSNPEVGSVGKTEQLLIKEGIPYKKGMHFVRALARSHASNETAGVVKVLAGSDGELLGIHVAGPGATEIIHSGVVAITAGMKVDQLAETIFGHPTISEAISIAASNAQTSS